MDLEHIAGQIGYAQRLPGNTLTGVEKRVLCKYAPALLAEVKRLMERVEFLQTDRDVYAGLLREEAKEVVRLRERLNAIMGDDTIRD